MLKSSASLLESDPRFRDLVFRNATTGEIRPMQIEDLHRMMQPLELNPTVPADIRQQFDTARNAFVYSWFAYDLATVAEQQAYGVLENALRQRFHTDGGDESKKPALGNLLEIAVARGWLMKKDFEGPSMSGSGEPTCFLDLIPRIRNELAHGNMHLIPDGSLTMMRLCADILNKLFPGSAGGLLKN
jgi:hypothetical protein